MRRVVLATGLAGVGGVHLHQVLVGVTKQVDRVVFPPPQRQVTNRVEQLHQLLIALGDRRAQFVAVYIQIIEQTFDVVLTVRTQCRCFDVLEDPLERLVKVLVARCTIADVGEQVGRQDVEALFRDDIVTREIRIRIR